MSANTNIVYTQLKRRSLLLLIVAITLSIGISTTAITSYNIIKNMLLESLKKQAILNVEKGRDDIDKWLSIRKTEIKTLANSPTARSMNWDIIEPYLQSELKRLKTFLLIALVKPDGALVNTQGSHTNVKDRESFQRLHHRRLVAALGDLDHFKPRLWLEILRCNFSDSQVVWRA